MRRAVIAGSRRSIGCVILFGLLMSGCISHTVHLATNQVVLPYQSMSKTALLEKLKSDSIAVKTLRVTKSSLSASRALSKEAIKEYSGLRSIIIVDRPSHLYLEIDKLITLVQMVSDGETYKVSIPAESKFGIGDVSASAEDAAFPYSLRPSHLLDALFVDGEQYIGDPKIGVFMHQAKEPQDDGMHSFYVIEFRRLGSEESIEDLWVDRTIMEVTRKIQYKADGQIEADIRYSRYGKVDSVPFPKMIVIDRPIENYLLQMQIEDMDINKPIEPGSFELERHAGYDEIDLNTGKAIAHP